MTVSGDPAQNADNAWDVLVAIPARNEAELIADCLAAVREAGEYALAAGPVRRVRVAVAAHRCTDDTAAIARRQLSDVGHFIDHLVIELREPAPVGRLRTLLIERAMTKAPALDPERTWVFSTDADSVVPPGWVTSTIAAATAAQADLVAGLTALHGWEADGAAQDAYARLLQAGMFADGHRHAYAANLAIRYPTLSQAGGFPPQPHGEEHGLIAAVRRQGGTVLTSVAPVVVTSARMPGRTEHGLGTLLRTLAEHRTRSENVPIHAGAIEPGTA